MISLFFLMAIVIFIIPPAATRNEPLRTNGQENLIPQQKVNNQNQMPNKAIIPTMFSQSCCLAA